MMRWAWRVTRDFVEAYVVKRSAPSGQGAMCAGQCLHWERGAGAVAYVPHTKHAERGRHQQVPALCLFTPLVDAL